VVYLLSGSYKVNGYWYNANSNILPMAKIVIDNVGKELVVDDLSKTLLKHFHEHRVDWMQSCGGKGKCTTCKVIVRAGFENFSAPTSVEWRYRAVRGLNDNERLACQTKISGDVTISAPNEYKLPHITYLDEV
jgi:ferredoxin, 2Fe-2S